MVCLYSGVIFGLTPLSRLKNILLLANILQHSILVYQGFLTTRSHVFTCTFSSDFVALSVNGTQ